MPQSAARYTFRYFIGESMVSLMHIEANNDDEAVQLALDHRFGFDVEVWDDGRFVYGTDGSARRHAPRKP